MKHLKNAKISINQIAAWVEVMTARGGGVPSEDAIVRALHVTPSKAQSGRAKYFAKKKQAHT